MDFEGHQTAFNMSYFLVNELAGLFSRATEHYISGRIDKWYFSLKAAKLRAFNVIDKDERDILKEKEDKIQTVLYYILVDLDDKSENFKKHVHQKKQEVIKLIEDYSESLTDILGRHGLLFTQKEDSRHI